MIEAMWVKICGIRDLETAAAVAELRPDAVGLNFYGRSPRCVDPNTAAEIVGRLPVEVASVGVFVNHSIAEIVNICRTCRLTTVQLHGDETIDFLKALAGELPNVRMLRAWRLGTNGLESLADYLSECGRLGVKLAGCLVDAHVPGEYGGTGRCVSWSSLRREYRREDWPPLILAGGLHPGNVAQAIHEVRPWGVDVASGVEAFPAVKDLRKIQQFLDAARRAFHDAAAVSAT